MPCPGMSLVTSFKYLIGDPLNPGTGHTINRIGCPGFGHNYVQGPFSTGIATATQQDYRTGNTEFTEVAQKGIPSTYLSSYFTVLLGALNLLVISIM